MDNKTGLILDISGIQKYIFETNRLKQIVGASGNVRNLISKEGGVLLSILKDRGNVKYTGGGNALILFDEEKKAKDFAKEWSLYILEQYPGIQPVVGIYTGTYSDNAFGEFLFHCRKALKNTKAENAVNTLLPRFGITAECIYTGNSVQFYDSDIKAKPETKENEYYSIIAKTKDGGYKKANQRFLDEYGFNFSENFEDLSGETGEGYRSGMAIVHIDGNDMGKMFSSLKKFKEFEDKSAQVRGLFNKALKAVTNEVDDITEKYLKKMGLENNVFPFRPIIVGGDDITYVCHSSLGLWSAHAILKNISNQQEDVNDKITACAGIAFTKPSYPFSQGYELAEELCENAKKKRRKGSEITKNISFLDFHILKGGAFSDLDTVREQGYKLGNQSLIGRPFGVEKGQEAYGWLMATAKKMITGKDKWPKNKLKELRETVYKGKDTTEAFYTHMKKQKKNIPNLESRDQRDALGKPLELDLCEFLDVYPEWLLDWNNNYKEESK